MRGDDFMVVLLRRYREVRRWEVMQHSGYLAKWWGSCV